MNLNSLVKISFEIFSFYSKNKLKNKLNVITEYDFKRFTKDIGIKDEKLINTIFNAKYDQFLIELSKKEYYESNNEKIIAYSGFYDSIQDIADYLYPNEIKPYSTIIIEKLEPLLEKLRLSNDTKDILNELKPILLVYESGLKKIYKYFKTHNKTFDSQLSVDNFVEVLRFCDIYPTYISFNEIVNICEHDVNNHNNENLNDLYIYYN